MNKNSDLDDPFTTGHIGLIAENLVKAEKGIRDNLESLVVRLQGPINPVQDKSTGQISNMPMGLIGRLYAVCERQEKTQTEIITLLQKLKDLLS